MDNEEMEAVYIVNTCLRCEKKFKIKDWKLSMEKILITGSSGFIGKS